MVEGLEGIDERAGSVVDGKKDRGAVVAGGRAWLLADDEEAGGVGRAVLDGFLDEGEPVKFGGERATEGGGTMGSLVSSNLCGLGGGGNLDEVCLREVFKNPGAALTEDWGWE